MTEDNDTEKPSNGTVRTIECDKPLRSQSPGVLRRLRGATWVAVLALLLIVSGYAGWRAFGPPSPPMAKAVSQAQVKSEFELVDHHGNEVSEQDFKGRWQLVFFGYTYCPDVCPTTLGTIGEVLDTLGNNADRVAALFVTVDPERDTPDVMAEYVAAFHPRLVGLTGTPKQVQAAAASFRVYFSKAEADDAPDGYLMAHSGYIYLMAPNGEYEAVFTENFHPPDVIADEIEKRLASGGRK